MQRTVLVCDRYGTTRDVAHVKVTVEIQGALAPDIFEGDLGPRAITRAYDLIESIFEPTKTLAGKNAEGPVDGIA